MRSAAMDKLGALIAVGLTAEIFAWREGCVLKLFRLGRSPQTLEYEARLSRAVHATGLPVPAVGDVIEMNGRFGLELERVDGPSMTEMLIRKPWKLPLFARQLANLQADMHTRQVPELPSQKECLISKISGAEKLPEQVRRGTSRVQRAQLLGRGVQHEPRRRRVALGDARPREDEP
ncbi:MAG: hypothetical protein FIA98_08825, partial [Anaerolineae bacterium]|nr:hypothetical protein [Anaerolineae bacterium]